MIRVARHDAVDAAQRFRIPGGACGQGLQRVEQRAQNRRLNQRSRYEPSGLALCRCCKAIISRLHGFFGTRIFTRGVLALDTLVAVWSTCIRCVARIWEKKRGNRQIRMMSTRHIIAMLSCAAPTPSTAAAWSPAAHRHHDRLA